MGACLRNDGARLHLRSARGRRTELGPAVASAGRRARIVPARRASRPSSKVPRLGRCGQRRFITISLHRPGVPPTSVPCAGATWCCRALRPQESSSFSAATSTRAPSPSVESSRWSSTISVPRSFSRPPPASGGRDRSAVERRVGFNVYESDQRRISVVTWSWSGGASPRSVGGHFSVARASAAKRL